MKGRRIFGLFLVLMVAGLALAACQSATPPEEGSGDTTGDSGGGEEFVFGMILVGPKNDRGWSQAHFEGGQYVEANIPNSRMIVFEKLNPADQPEATVEGVVDDMVSQGATMIILTSDEFEEDTVGAAEKHPDVTFIMASGDDAWADGQNAGVAPANVGNVMGRMEYMKALAGCAAALKSETGSIAYLGPLINFETRRLASSVYQGAKYCWENYRGNDAADLTFTVTWIGFWFNIPGVTLDPTEVTNQFFDSGADVVISGIDTSEAIVVTGQRAAAGESVWAVPYDYEGACDEAPDVCLGVPFFNWGPAYVGITNQVIDGSWKQSFDWNGPNWANLTDKDTTAVGWVDGPALTGDAHDNLHDYMDKLASGDANPWRGPINLQDGSEYVADGQDATDPQIWYVPQLLEGMTGPSQ